MDWRLALRAATALAFAAAAAYAIWRVEWFDVFRWGVPGPGLLAVYASYAGAAGIIGWLLAALFTPRTRSARQPTRRHRPVGPEERDRMLRQR